MATATEGSPRCDIERRRALLDYPQPLGIVPTRRFWTDRENLRLVRIPQAIIAGVLVLVILLLDLPWWGAGLAAMGTMLLMEGLFERYIRYAAKRRFRSRPAPPALAEDHPDSLLPPDPVSPSDSSSPAQTASGEYSPLQ